MERDPSQTSGRLTRQQVHDLKGHLNTAVLHVQLVKHDVQRGEDPGPRLDALASTLHRIARELDALVESEVGAARRESGGER